MQSQATALTQVVEVTKAQIGKPAPDFDLASTKNIKTLGDNVKLSDYRGKSSVVLAWFPKAFTGG